MDFTLEKLYISYTHNTHDLEKDFRERPPSQNTQNTQNYRLQGTRKGAALFRSRGLLLAF